MTNEIKQKIEQIKKGEVPEGYCYSRAGFSPNDWEKGILDDVLYNEQRSVEKPKEPYWRVGIRSHAKGTFHEYVENPETVDMDELYVVRENDLIINITFAWEHAVALADKNDDGLLVSHRFPTYVFKEGQNPVFFKSVIIQKRFKELLALISPGGAGRNRVMSKKDFLHLPCNIPPFAEQQKIAEILMECDKVIELKQKLIDETKKLKKAFLSKMFPQKGENTPEIRFPGFTASWEQRRLGEVGSCQSGIGFPDDEQGETEGIPFFKVSDMNISGNEYELLYSNNYVTQEQIKRKKWKPITEVPAMFFAKVGAAVMLNRKRLVNTPFLLDNNTMAYKFGDEWDTNFGRTLFDTINLASLVQVGALPSYNANDVEGIEISLPTLEEQQQIGAFFSRLDTLITLHQRELQEWQNKKRALMQLLLTGIVRVKI